MGTGRQRKALQGASRFSLEENYEEFQRVHGFDIRGLRSEFPATKYLDTRDTRDPAVIGELILNRPRDESPEDAVEMTVLEVAEQIEEYGVDALRAAFERTRANRRSLNGKAGNP